MSFKRLDPEDISISAESIVAPAWSTDKPTLEEDTGANVGFFFSTTQANENSGKFYYKVYQKDPGQYPQTAKCQFAIAYGHKTGLGSQPYDTANAILDKSPSSTIYGQYRNLVFGDEDTDFTFQSETSDDIYVISIDRARYKEKLFPGTFNIVLENPSGKKLFLTDNSNDVNSISFVDSGRIYDIVSGSNGTAEGQEVANGYNLAGGSYGKFLPDVGTLIFNGKALAKSFINGGIALATNLDQTSTQEKNHEIFFDAIKAGDSFKLQSEETISSNFVFVRVRNSEFNYSTNPSNITSSGELRHDVMINTPQAYITTVGLYNDNNDLVAVAKLSRPLLKDFTKEALVRIKLDY